MTFPFTAIRPSAHAAAGRDFDQVRAFDMTHPFRSSAGKRHRPQQTGAFASGRALAVALAAGFAFAPLPGPTPLIGAGAALAADDHIVLRSTRATQHVKVGLDKALVIDLPADAHDVLVANPKIADAVVRTVRRLYVFGKRSGQSNIFVFGRDGKQVAALDLRVERDIRGLERTISRYVPSSDVRAEVLNGNLVLTGTTQNPQDAARAVELATVFMNGANDGAAAGGGFATLFGVSGQGESKVVNLIKIMGDDQVHLKVMVAEVNRSVMKQLGIATGVQRDAGENGFNFSALAQPGSGLVPTAFTNGVGTLSNGLIDYTAGFRAMEQTGVMRTLAEPSMTAVSGEEAKFEVGGRFQIASSAAAGEEEGDGATVTFREVEYGIKMQFKPVVLTGGRINLKIKTEVSEPTTLDQAPAAVRGAPLNLLGIRNRLADTVVELPSGGSMMIAGLVQDDIRQSVSGLPGASKIPFFGSLFRSREFVRNETELVVIVTPYIVRPTAPRNLKRPDEGLEMVGDGAAYLLGRINKVYGVKKGKLPAGRYIGTVGFIYK